MSSPRETFNRFPEVGRFARGLLPFAQDSFDEILWPFQGALPPRMLRTIR